MWQATASMTNKYANMNHLCVLLDFERGEKTRQVTCTSPR
jgi:hypothetical protein